VKILLVHNFYREHGGESAVFEAERRMLRAAGHSVISYTRDSNEIEGFGPWKRATLTPTATRPSGSPPGAGLRRSSRRCTRSPRRLHRGS
jgi:hypothetical protein